MNDDDYSIFLKSYKQWINPTINNTSPFSKLNRIITYTQSEVNKKLKYYVPSELLNNVETLNFGVTLNCDIENANYIAVGYWQDEQNNIEITACGKNMIIITKGIKSVFTIIGNENIKTVYWSLNEKGQVFIYLNEFKFDLFLSFNVSKTFPVIICGPEIVNNHQITFLQNKDLNSVDNTTEFKFREVKSDEKQKIITGIGLTVGAISAAAAAAAAYYYIDSSSALITAKTLHDWYAIQSYSNLTGLVVSLGVTAAIVTTIFKQVQTVISSLISLVKHYPILSGTILISILGFLYNFATMDLLIESLSFVKSKFHDFTNFELNENGVLQFFNTFLNTSDFSNSFWSPLIWLHNAYIYVYSTTTSKVFSLETVMKSNAWKAIAKHIPVKEFKFVLSNERNIPKWLNELNLRFPNIDTKLKSFLLTRLNVDVSTFQSPGIAFGIAFSFFPILSIILLLILEYGNQMITNVLQYIRYGYNRLINNIKQRQREPFLKSLAEFIFDNPDTNALKQAIQVNNAIQLSVPNSRQIKKNVVPNSRQIRSFLTKLLNASVKRSVKSLIVFSACLAIVMYKSDFLIDKLNLKGKNPDLDNLFYISKKFNTLSYNELKLMCTAIKKNPWNKDLLIILWKNLGSYHNFKNNHSLMLTESSKLLKQYVFLAAVLALMLLTIYYKLIKPVGKRVIQLGSSKAEKK